MSILVLVLVPFSAICITAQYHADDRERERLVQAVERLGGQVLDIDWDDIDSEIETPFAQSSDTFLVIPQISLGAEWLRWRKRFFGDIDFVIFGDFLDMPGAPNREVIDDDALEEIAHLPARNRVRALYLEGTSVTDAGVTSLARFRGLKRLDLRNTRVTAEGIKRLELALPNCTIVM